MDKSYKKKLNQEYVLFSGGAVPIDTYAVQMVIHCLLSGILPCRLYTMDEQQIWSCEYTGKISLLEYCRNKDLSGTDLQWIGRGILSNLKELQEYLLEEKRLLLGAEDIYIDMNDQKVWNCYVPFSERNVWNGLLDLSQFFLGHLDQKDSAAVKIGYGLFRYLNQDRCNLDELWAIFNGETMKIDMNDSGEDELSEELKIESCGNEKEVLFQKNELKATAVSKEKKWSLKKAVLCTFPFVIALFLVIYLIWNEWYLASLLKILIIGMIGVCLICGVVLVRKWKVYLIKENPLEHQTMDTETIEKDREQDKYDRQEAMYQSWKESDLQKEDIVQPVIEETTHTGEIVLEERNNGRESNESVWGRLMHIDTKEELLLTENPTVIGKLAEVSQLLIQSPYVSRVHARIWIKDGDVYAEDLNSKNGTYVNGVRIEKQKPVRVNLQDELAFANMRYYFQL